MVQRISIWILLLWSYAADSFSPSKTDFDAFGVKIAANDLLFVQARGADETFLIQFAPYSDNFNSLQCSLGYSDSAHYVYSVGLGSKQDSLNNSLFFFFGEDTSESDASVNGLGRNRTFIGRIKFDDSTAIPPPGPGSASLSCQDLVIDSMEFVSNYEHQEYSVMGVEPTGTYAFVMATDFVFRYEPTSTNGRILVRSGNTTWPQNVTFYPCAIDLTETFTVVAGFVRNSIQSRTRATPTIYVMSNDNFTVLSSWSYTPANNSWQSQLTYSGVGTSWNSQYTMSVKINPVDRRRVLVGMPFLNTVFMFVVENNGITLRLMSNDDSGQGMGFGKSVTWLDNSQAAILDWSYTLHGKIFLSAEINIYTSMNNTTIPDQANTRIPNIYQMTPLTIASEWIRMVSTPSSLAIMDVLGGTLMILSQPPGYYAATNGTDEMGGASMPVVSRRSACLAGTFKSGVGVYPCELCPSGTQNSNGTGAASCLNCSSEGFCPLGATHEVNTTWLTNLSQAYAYPRTPDMNVFEDILLNNMFTLGSTSHCLMVSPIFWILIFLFIVLVLLISMALLNFCMAKSRREKCRKAFKSFFRQADFVGEGELWLGGLASLAIALMTIMAYNFAIKFLNQYPAENVGPSTFACDPDLRNSKYSSSLQSLAVPISDSERILFDMLNRQNFTFNIDLLSTITRCEEFIIVEIINDESWRLIPISCGYFNGVLSASVRLRQQKTTILVTLNSDKLFGGLRIGFAGPGREDDVYTLQELNFRKSFIDSRRTLSRKITITLDMTKVINETESLSSSNSVFSGIWYPTFKFSETDIFTDASGYLLSSQSSLRTITIILDESTYYIKNLQSPIAKESEVIFRTLLFVFLCLELCAIGFLICKLILFPIIKKIYRLFHHRKETLRTNDPTKDNRL